MPSPGLRNRWWNAMHVVHRWAGLLTGVFLVVTALTGTALLLADVANWRGYRPVAPGRQLADLRPAMTEAVERFREYALTNVLVPRYPEQGWILLFRHPRSDDRVIADVDPYTGRLLGYRDFDRTVFRVLLDLHYTYFAGAAGKVVSTGVGLALILLSVTGVWIHRRAIRGLFRLRREPRTGRAAHLHKWVGPWALVLALLWGVTGLIQMATILPAAFRPVRRFTASDPAQFRRLASTNRIIEAARAAAADAELISFSPPTGDKNEMRVAFIRRDAWPWNKRLDVLVDARTATVTKLVTPSAMKPVDRIQATVHALHFGFYGPDSVLVLYVLGAVLVVSLPLTGIAISLGRRRTG